MVTDFHVAKQFCDMEAIYTYEVRHAGLYSKAQRSTVQYSTELCSNRTDKDSTSQHSTVQNTQIFHGGREFMQAVRSRQKVGCCTLA